MGTHARRWTAALLRKVVENIRCSRPPQERLWHIEITDTLLRWPCAHSSCRPIVERYSITRLSKFVSQPLLLVSVTLLVHAAVQSVLIVSTCPGARVTCRVGRPPHAIVTTEDCAPPS